ncbi:hypothetical protein G6F68_021607 [Rhizopus microsporus]|nr:hypothetical protein G6F68_021607 [Rhizopus microsporus]
MPRAEGVCNVRIVFAARVGIANQQADRRTRGDAFVDAGQNLDLIGLLALRDMARGARTAAVQFKLDVGRVQAESRGTAIHDATDGRPVGFAEIRDGKEST